jgi:hypothetical protein
LRGILDLAKREKLAGTRSHESPSHHNSPGCTSLSQQNKKRHYLAKCTNCLSFKIATSLSKSTAITFPATVHKINCSRFSFRQKFFVDHTLFTKKATNIVLDL